MCIQYIPLNIQMILVCISNGINMHMHSQYIPLNIQMILVCIFNGINMHMHWQYIPLNMHMISMWIIIGMHIHIQYISSNMQMFLVYIFNGIYIYIYIYIYYIIYAYIHTIYYIWYANDLGWISNEICMHNNICYFPLNMHKVLVSFINESNVFSPFSTETKRSSYWRPFHHWLYLRLSEWQPQVQPVMRRLSIWWPFGFSVIAAALVKRVNPVSSVHFHRCRLGSSCAYWP